jgi:hypothetical protein
MKFTPYESPDPPSPSSQREHKILLRPRGGSRSGRCSRDQARGRLSRRELRERSQASRRAPWPSHRARR